MLHGDSEESSGKPELGARTELSPDITPGAGQGCTLCERTDLEKIHQHLRMQCRSVPGLCEKTGKVSSEFAA